MSPATVTNHFGSPELLLAAVVERLMTDIQVPDPGIFADSTSLDDRVRILTAAMFGFRPHATLVRPPRCRAHRGSGPSVDAITARPADLVLIGIHRANSSRAEATSLLLGMHPTTVIIVFGSPSDIDVLAAAYIRGARGLLPWVPGVSGAAVPASEGPRRPATPERL